MNTKETKIEASVVRETEKALYIDTTIDTLAGLQSKRLWVPKSQVQEIGKNYLVIKSWILGKKEKELRRLHPRWDCAFLVLN